jgi:hypothetical protein
MRTARATNSALRNATAAHADASPLAAASTRPVGWPRSLRPSVVPSGQTALEATRPSRAKKERRASTEDPSSDERDPPPTEGSAGEVGLDGCIEEEEKERCGHWHQEPTPPCTDPILGGARTLHER